MEWFLEFYNSGFGKLSINILFYGIISIIGFRFCKIIVNKLSNKLDPTALHWRLLKQFLKIAWILIFILSVVESVPNMDKVATALVACSSVIVAALGLASQDALGNAIDGVFISLFKPFAVNDRIRLVDRNITGIVTGINLRYTTVRTAENNILMIPNSIMNDEIIENSSIKDSNIKAFVDVEITYDSNVQLAKQILTDIISNHPLFVDIRTEEEIKNGKPIVTILLRNLTANGVELRATVCSENINDSFNLCSDVRESILLKFKEYNIDIPYQTITVIERKEKGVSNE